MKNALLILIQLTLSVFLIGCSCCSTNAPVTDHSLKPPQSAIASAHPIATQAGMDILNQGGNAFDAAVAVAATLAVVEPYSAGMGGGGFWLLHNAESGEDIFVDAREKAPSKSHKTMYLNSEGQVDRDKAINGPLAAGVPGQAAAFVHIAKRYGKLPLDVSLAPAIKAAEKGFPAHKPYIRLLSWRKKVMERYPSSIDIFFNTEGEVPEEGYLIIQKDLAKTLKSIASQGFSGFYQGAVAQKLVKSVQKHGGIWTLDDLANYEVKERTPIRFNYQNYEIISAPPPSSGGVALATMLNILNLHDFDQKIEAEQTHLIVEAMRRAYRDRAEFLGDSDFVDIPVETLISQEHAAELNKNITQKATPSTSLKPVAQIHQGNHTTHFSILDQKGNRVSATLSINLPFGSGFVAEETGVLLNNEMDDFSAKPNAPNAYGLVGSEANAIAPGKRPLSSMSPTFVSSSNFEAIIGTPGGSRIITMVLLGILEHVEGNPPIDWVSRPRFHHQYLPDAIQMEPNALPQSVMDDLRNKGHKFDVMNRQYGNMQGILWHKSARKVMAASDPRGIGEATVTQIKGANN